MKALVAIFTVLLIGISIYQLSFTWFVNSYEKQLDAKTQRYIKANFPSPEQKYPGNKELQQTYREDTVAYYTTRYRDSLREAGKDKKITWWGQSYQKAKESELLLGLDLQGGINVTLDISLDGLIKGLANNPKDAQLTRAIAEAQRRKLSSDRNFIDLFASAYHDLFPAERLAPHFANASRNTLGIDASDNQVVSFIRQQAGDAMRQTYQVLRKRIDKFGVSQPSINLDETRGNITVELAGASDPERVRRYLQSTANLQFWEVYSYQPSQTDPSMIGPIQAADKALADNLYGVTPPTTDTSKTNPDSTRKADSAKNANAAAESPDRVNPLLRLLRPTFPQQGQDGRYQYSATLGRPLIKDTSTINRYLSLPTVRNNFPANSKFLWGKQLTDDKGTLTNFLDLYLIKTVPGKESAPLEGDVIENARQDYDQIGKVVVSMSMSAKGDRIWAEMTGRNIGRPIAIVLDDIVYSAPFVNQKIEGGNSQITMGGGKDNALLVQEAQDLANILKSGKLQAPAKIVQEQVVGPTLGRESVRGGIMAFGIAFLVIFVLMLVYYNTAGIVADIALILNLLFTIGVLSALGATLTAPGIAGLVLTIGMAVDTNVIIFERIKEELAHGLSHEQAIKIGYRRSLPPVLDAHITTLLTAIILAIYGLGPVLGFATTQILGILLSLFCGILVSRLITDFWTNKKRHFSYFTNLSKRIFQHANFKFIQYRRVAYGISVVVLLLGVGSIFHGFNEGVEFKGGRSYIVNFHQPVNIDAVRNALDKTFGKFPVIKTYGSPSKLDITTDYKISEAGTSVDSSVLHTLYNGILPFIKDKPTYAKFTTTEYIEGTKKVDPVISDDLKSGAKWATFWSILIITIYIFIRFRDWRYSLGTIVALLHDVLVTLAVFSFLKDVVPFPLEIDQHFIAAILTVIGFSMNDTVIVFDRIREYSRHMKGATKGEVINKAINDTLSRTIMTSLTVFLTLLILFLVGGEVTKGFAFAMLIGVITGTYSSIFVAAPILVDFAKSKPLGQADFVEHSTGVKKKPALAKNV